MSALDLEGFAVLILAAGQSKRMGQTNKLLQEISGRPLIAHVFDTVAHMRLGECLVVTGYERTPIKSLADHYGLKTIHNPDFAEGMGSSIRTGAQALHKPCKGVFIHLGDIPFVSPKTFAALASVLLHTPNSKAQIFAPVYQGRRGHPVLFCGSLIPRLAKLEGDSGGRALLDSESLIAVPVDDPFICRDVDTNNDLQSLRDDHPGK